MRFITLALTFGSALASFKSIRRLTSFKKRRKDAGEEKKRILIPTEYKDYNVVDTDSTCRINVTVQHGSFVRPYEVSMSKEGATGLRVQSARCGLERRSPRRNTGRSIRSTGILTGKQKFRDLLGRLSTVPGGLDGQDCNSRLSRVHRALARRSGKYKLLVDAVGAPLPSALAYGQESFFRDIRRGGAEDGLRLAVEFVNADGYYQMRWLTLSLLTSGSAALSIRAYSMKQAHPDACEVTIDVSREGSAAPENYRLMLNKKPMKGGAMDLHYAQCGAGREGSDTPFQWETVELKDGKNVRSPGSRKLRTKNCEDRVSAAHEQLHKTNPQHRAVTANLKTAEEDDLKVHLMALVETVCAKYAKSN
ncbi:hypothetical protein FOZ60_013708 [Perkinsus olseni]|uniref:Uncharacterized protein n=1 Tax=Perkinsus olseni TaxID=32597 RepID=A0A7J6P9K4_PEROL|nr:hypothetical protein FOZ60_013708 [Perkinsus olseni]